MKNKILFFYFIITIFPFLLFSNEEKVNIVGRVSMLKAYKNYLYFLNESECNIWRFDQNLKFLNKIGKKGEGPGEITFLSNFNFLEDKIYTFSRGKLLIFGLDGTLLNEAKFPVRNSSIILLRKGNMVEKIRDFSYERGKTTIQKIRFLDKDFNQIVEVLSEHTEISPGYEFEAIDPYIYAKYSDKNGLVYISNPARDFLIMIFDENGKLVGKISKNYEKVRVAKDFRERFLETLIEDPHVPSKEMAKALLKKLHFPKYFPPFHSFYLDEEGYLYVRTYKRKNKKTIFEKYSPSGSFIKEYALTDEHINIVDCQNFISISEGNYYYLYENENGEYILHREKLY